MANTSPDSSFLGVSAASRTRIIQSIGQLGLTNSLFRTFGISAIVWFSFVAGVSLVLNDRTIGVRLREIALGLGFVFLVILPIGALSWIAVTGLSLYILFSTDVTTSRRGAYILLATTVPMFWSRMLFQFFSNLILDADASLVSWLLGTHRTGNLVEFSDKSGQLAIYPPCSSLANVSLAFLCWITISQLVSHRRSGYDFFWCFLACALVVATNVMRISIIGLSQWHYATFHNQWGDAVANLIMLALIVFTCAFGVRRELLQRI